MDSQKRHVLLERIAEELAKDNPEKSFVREGMEQVGLSYTENPILCMNSVLRALHSGGPGKEMENGKES